MGVPCPGCAREYDVTLFEFGRTIHCTCGRRVGLEARVRALEEGAPVRFMVDAMLGRLATWLRLLGFDAAYEADAPDADVVRRALDEGRALLTRDRSLPEEWRIADVYVVRGENPFEQLREVVHRFELTERLQLFTRCSVCNAPLEVATRDEARGRVPNRILASEHDFRRCPACDRIYWSGSHTDRIRSVVDRIAEKG